MTTLGICRFCSSSGHPCLTKPVGLFMSRVFQGERTFLHPVLRPIEVLVYRLCGVREDDEQHWTPYAASVLAFHVRLSVPVRVHAAAGLLPLNPQGFGTARARCSARPVVQHRHELHDQHELAVVQRRDRR